MALVGTASTVAFSRLTNAVMLIPSINPCFLYHGVNRNGFGVLLKCVANGVNIGIVFFAGIIG